MNQNKNFRKKGFTLLELLVVVAIIGILTSIVIVSLTASKAKGIDGGIQSELVHARNQIELYYAANGNYGTAYFTFPPVTNYGRCGRLVNSFLDTSNANGAIAASAAKTASILDNAGKLSNGTDLTNTNCVSTASTWAISVPLKTDSSYSWCVDSTGASRKVQPLGSPSDKGFSGSACK